MKKLSFNYLINKLKRIKFSKFDFIVAIGKDGIMPASLLQHFLNIPIEIIWLNYRDKNNKPIRKNPILKKPFKKIKNKRILLVDTVSRTGKTLKKAKQLLKGNKIKTFVINGKADYNIINKKECVLMPWK
jgi:hypoxanthine phosphoribosyltransferase